MTQDQISANQMKKKIALRNSLNKLENIPFRTVTPTCLFSYQLFSISCRMPQGHYQWLLKIPRLKYRLRPCSMPPTLSYILGL